MSFVWALAAATARVGVATADLFPRFSLTGTFGFESASIGDLTNERYTRGLVDFLNVLESQRQLYTSEDQLLQSERGIVVNLVALYKALGGGWEVFSQVN